MAINWKVSKADFKTIELIADRAVGMAHREGIDATKQDFMMDVTAAHKNGNGLRLEELLAADEFNFAHDILGIRRHLDRETGKISDFFVPRFAVRR